VRYLILSDIHGNWEALEAVLNAAREDGYEHVLCCGDVVGYGADPNAVTDWVRSTAAYTVRGNHDKACVGLENLDWFNPVARTSALWTASILRPENIEYLKKLPKGPVPVNNFQILHGSPMDEDEYLMQTGEVAQWRAILTRAIHSLATRMCQGGSFLRMAGSCGDCRAWRAGRSRGVDARARALLSGEPGSVGRPA
jgi:hypothetical protein